MTEGPDQRRDRLAAWDRELAEHGRVEFRTRRGRAWGLLAVAAVFVVAGGAILVDERSFAGAGAFVLGLGGVALFSSFVRHRVPLVATHDELRVQLAWGQPRTYARSAIACAARISSIGDQLWVYVATEWLKVHRPPTNAMALRQMDRKESLQRNLPANLESPDEVCDWITDWALADPANPWHERR